MAETSWATCSGGQWPGEGAGHRFACGIQSGPIAFVIAHGRRYPVHRHPIDGSDDASSG